MHLRENYADDATLLRWVNSNLLFMHSLELLVTRYDDLMGLDWSWLSIVIFQELLPSRGMNFREL